MNADMILSRVASLAPSVQMSTDLSFWRGAFMALLILIIILAVLARYGYLPAMGKESYVTRRALEKKVDDLATTIDVLQEARVQDALRMRDLERANNRLEYELGQAKTEIASLRQELVQYRAEVSRNALDFPLLAIFGPEPKAAQAGEAALNQSGMAFRRIANATKALITEELLRRRPSGDLYRWLCVFTHATSEGMVLADGIAKREWWNEQLRSDPTERGIEGVYLMGCSDVKVADWLIGVVRWVLAVAEDVDIDLAQRFTCTFFTQLVRKPDAPREAYRVACRAVPTLAKYTDFRER